MALAMVGIFTFACLPLIDMGPITPEEIAKNRGSSNVPIVWLFFGIGVLFLALTLWQIWMHATRVARTIWDRARWANHNFQRKSDGCTVVDVDCAGNVGVSIINAARVRRSQ